MAFFPSLDELKNIQRHFNPKLAFSSTIPVITSGENFDCEGTTWQTS
jgi:hypothetical protein